MEKRPSLMILAGGKGTRLGKLTKLVPKPMIDIFGKPFLYWLIKYYRSQGFNTIWVKINHLQQIIKSYDWPETWNLKIERDFNNVSHLEQYVIYENEKPYWVVNGDTWITEPLPNLDTGPAILTCKDIDAGAQLIGNGKIKVIPVSKFFDIGTPQRLGEFKEYFKTHPLYLTHIANDNQTANLELAKRGTYDNR